MLIQHLLCAVHYTCKLAGTEEVLVDTRAESASGQPFRLVAGRGAGSLMITHLIKLPLVAPVPWPLPVMYQTWRRGCKCQLKACGRSCVTQLMT